MRSMLLAASLAISSMLSMTAQVPENLVVEGVPAITPELRKDVGRYLEFRAAAFNSWHPQRREMLLSTRFADSTQLHLVKAPGGARQFHPRHFYFGVSAKTGHPSRTQEMLPRLIRWKAKDRRK